MTKPLAERISDYQELLLEVGIAGASVTETAPRTLLSTVSLTDNSPELAFGVLVTEEEIKSVAGDLFSSGHYNIAVSQAYKALDKFVEAKSKIKGKSGRDLMNAAFSPNKPKLTWTDMKTKSEINEQEGYHLMFSGVMAAVRNPVTHEFGWVDEPREALDLILIAQHLLRKAKQAQPPTQPLP